ncbi:MAG TPA: energy transducer TonB [Terriglobales bacterium]|nr:energy transducer TonB [Terriglobales bacterium]
MAAVALLLARAMAADPPKTPDVARNDAGPPVPELTIRPPAPAVIQSEAETLLERARRLSDIRGLDSPPFRLKADFTFIGDELETFAGSYTEYWVSDSKWRKEIVVGERKRVDIAGAKNVWEIDTEPLLPDKAWRIVQALSPFPARSLKVEYAAVKDAPTRAGVRCALTKSAGASRAQSAFCFDQAYGVLVEHIIPQWGRYNLTDIACVYGGFQKFGGQWFPRDVECRQGGHRQMEAHVTELAMDESGDPARFDPPPGATELDRCDGGIVAPKADYTPTPPPPLGMRDAASWTVLLRMVIDANGKPQNVQVVRPGNKSFDEAAARAAEHWRFKPATCDGQPIVQRIEFEIGSRSY